MQKSDIFVELEENLSFKITHWAHLAFSFQLARLLKMPPNKYGLQLSYLASWKKPFSIIILSYLFGKLLGFFKWAVLVQGISSRKQRFKTNDNGYTSKRIYLGMYKIFLEKIFTLYPSAKQLVFQSMFKNSCTSIIKWKTKLKRRRIIE